MPPSGTSKPPSALIGRNTSGLGKKREPALRYVDFEDAAYINKQVMKSDKIGMLGLGNLRFCLERARSVAETGIKESDLTLKAAHLIFCIIRNHPFLDGNKRTAFQCAYIFLQLNDYTLHGIAPDEATGVLSSIAAGEQNLTDVQSWVRKHLTPL
jgi:death on curing protein